MFDIDAYQDPDGGELIPREVYLRAIADYFNDAQQRDPDWYNLEALPPGRRAEFDEKARELQMAGPMTKEGIRRVILEIEGIFDRAFWERQNFKTFVLDANGRVEAVLVPQLNAWATHRDFFLSSDGRPVLRLDDFEAAEKTEQ